MTYVQDEESRFDSAPVECYEFVGTFTTYRYTSSEVDVVADFGSGSQTYTAVPMMRNEVVTQEDGSAPALAVTVPINLQMVADYAFDISPPALFLTLRRLQADSGYFRQTWKGEVSAWSVAEREVSLRVPDPLARNVEQELPRVFYQGLCNNKLFDEQCGVVEDVPYRTLAINVDAIDDTEKVFTISEMGSIADQWARGGKMTVVASGETRLITDHTGDQITVLWPFSSIAVPNSVIITAGCNHSLDDCHNKFGGNTANFLGAPYIPTASVFDKL